MELIYGTLNTAKLAYMEKCLRGMPAEYEISIIGLSEAGSDWPEIAENGNDPLENARIKALAYYKVIKRPVFSADSGLYFDGLPPELQPGLNVRRVNGKRLNDDEMIEYYAGLAGKYGGRLVARYINGICLVMGESLIYEHMGEDIATDRFVMTDKPHTQRREGFPIDSLSVQLESGRYYYDLDPSESDDHEEWHTRKGFCNFFASALRAAGECAWRDSNPRPTA